MILEHPTQSAYSMTTISRRENTEKLRKQLRKVKELILINKFLALLITAVFAPQNWGLYHVSLNAPNIERLRSHFLIKLSTLSYDWGIKLAIPILTFIKEFLNDPTEGIERDSILLRIVSAIFLLSEVSRLTRTIANSSPP